MRHAVSESVNEWGMQNGSNFTGSVAEPPLFWAAPALDGQGPGADSGSNRLGSAPGQAKKGGAGSIH